MAEEQKKAGAPSQKKKVAVKKGEELTRWGKIQKWFREMKAELKKVVWPNKSTVVKNTSVALAVMAVAAIAIWGFDQIAQLGVKALINLVG